MSATQSPPSAPEPVKKRVLLVSEGVPGKKFTVHYYVATEPVMIDGAPYWSFIYECFETGVKRRYGIADRSTLADAELEDEIRREGN